MAFLCVELQILKCEGEHFGMAQTFKEEIGKRKWINLESHETHFTQSALFSVKRMFANFSAWRLFIRVKTSWRFGIGFEFINYRKSVTSMKLFVDCLHLTLANAISKTWHTVYGFEYRESLFRSKDKSSHTTRTKINFRAAQNLCRTKKSHSRNETKPAKTPKKK